MDFAEKLLLFIQVNHILLLGASLFFLLKFNLSKKNNNLDYKISLQYGLLSIPLAILLFLVSLHSGLFMQATLYGISVIIGFWPIILAII